MYTHSSLTGVSETHIPLYSLSYCTKIRVMVVLGRSGSSLCGIYVAAVQCTVKSSCAQIFHIPQGSNSFCMERFMQTT